MKTILLAVLMLAVSFDTTDINRTCKHWGGKRLVWTSPSAQKKGYATVQYCTATVRE